MRNTIKNNNTLYQIDIKKSISEPNDFYKLIQTLTAGFLSWRERQNIQALQQCGFTYAKIAAVHNCTPQRIHHVLKETDQLTIDDSRKEDNAKNQ